MSYYYVIIGSVVPHIGNGTGSPWVSGALPVLVLMKYLYSCHGYGYLTGIAGTGIPMGNTHEMAGGYG